MPVHVLRLGHRPERDKRTTTHVALTARAFGAERMILPVADGRVAETLADVGERFGGDFEVVHEPSWRSVIRDWEGPVVHLTMYGRHVDEAADEIPAGDLLVVVGASKVPGEVYDLVDHNVAVGHQPHSEVAALAVLLDRVMGPEGLHPGYEGQIRVVPRDRGKHVVEKEGSDG